jgi:hypothetical protein
MNHLVETARSSSHLEMSRVFSVLQLNVRKQGEVHDSLMNDEEIQDTSNSRTTRTENPRPAPNNPNAASQMDQDGPINLARRAVANPEHALGK